jgi:hypothetical protein
VVLETEKRDDFARQTVDFGDHDDQLAADSSSFGGEGVTEVLDILLVDDEPRFARRWTSALRAQGHRWRRPPTAPEAMARLDARAFGSS